MNEHLTDDEIAGYRGKRLHPQELLTADDHLASCELCRGRLLKDAKFEPIDLPAGLTHLSYEQIAAYVDHLLDEVDTEIARSHIAVCQQCEDEVRDLEHFRGEFNRSPIPQPHAPLRVARRTWLPTGLRFSLLAAVAAVLVIVLVNRREPTLVALNDGGRAVTLSVSGEVRGLEDLPGGYKAQIRAALETGQLAIPPELSSLTRSGGILRGTSTTESFPLLDPIGTIVESDRPNFRWGALPGAEFYEAKVFQSNGKIAAASGRLTQPEWTPETALSRGVRLRWQVKAHRAGQEILAPGATAPEALFEIIPEAREAELSAARRQFPSFHLLLGTIYCEAGLLAEAEREFTELAQANPGARQAQALLNQVRELRATTPR